MYFTQSKKEPARSAKLELYRHEHPMCVSYMLLVLPTLLQCRECKASQDTRLALSTKSVLGVLCDTSAPDPSYQMAAFALAFLFRRNPV